MMADVNYSLEDYDYYNTSDYVIGAPDFKFEDYYNDTDYVIDAFDIEFHFYLYQLAVPILFGLISFVGLVGNSMVIYVILRRPHMRTTVNLSLLNLAFCDVTFVTICVPFVAYHYAADNWLIGDVMCKLSQFFLHVTMYVTIYILVLVSILRYLTIVHGASSVKIRTRRNVCLLIIIIWAANLIGNTPVLIVYRVKEIYYKEDGEGQHPPYYYCGVDNVVAGQRIFITFFFSAYVIPLIVIASLYLRILIYLQRKRTQSFRLSSRANGANGAILAAQDRTLHATKIVVIVVAVFGACWLPLHVHLLVAYFGKQPDTKVYQVFRMLFHCLAYANSCLNPFIYHYASKDFRHAFHSIFILRRNTQEVHSTIHRPSVDGNELLTNSHMTCRTQV